MKERKAHYIGVTFLNTILSFNMNLSLTPLYKVKVHLEGVNRSSANLMVNNAKFNNYKMNDANGQLKSRSEAGFPMKGFRTSPLYSSRQ